MSYIKLVKVTKKFESVVALDRITLEIGEGEFVSFLGPSGSGKTTLLRAIAGLTQLTEGEIFIGGTPVTNVEVRKRNLAMVFQNYALFPHLTVGENIGFGLKVRRASREIINREIKKLLDMVRLPQLENRLPHQLSGGQQQRIALARALAINPKVMLLDEPLGAIDKKLRMEMQIELKLLQKQVGVTTIFVTHDQEEALSMSDRIAVMNEGKIVQFGSPSNIYEKPASRFVSGFIGVSNYYECRIDGFEGQCAIAETPQRSRIFIDRGLLPTQTKKDESVVIAVRPEKIKIQNQKPKKSRNVFPATVRNLVYLGSLTHYYLQTENGEEVVVYAQNLDSLDGKTEFDLGDKVFIHWPPESSNVVST